MLSIRHRGKYWHVRGLVQEGRKKERVREHSSGEAEERAARQYADNLERDIKARLRLGVAAPKPETLIPFSEAVSRYVDIAKPKAGDTYRLEKLLAEFEDAPLSSLGAGDWERFCQVRLPGSSPNTRARYQTTLRAVFAEAGGGVPFPAEIKHRAKRVERVRWLPIGEADRLIEAYAYVDPLNGQRSAQSPHAKAIALTLRFLGLRSQECLQIQRPLFDDKRGPYGAVWIEKSKNGQERWAPLHPRVREAWEPLLSESRPVFLVNGRARDPLFLTDKRRPYTDTRVNGIGSNPFRRAHVNACARAGVTDFTPHDWRHHWASWAVRNGMDLRTLQEIGGWLDLNQVQRYAAVDFDDAAEKIARQK